MDQYLLFKTLRWYGFKPKPLLMNMGSGKNDSGSVKLSYFHPLTRRERNRLFDLIKRDDFPFKLVHKSCGMALLVFTMK